MSNYLPLSGSDPNWYGTQAPPFSSRQSFISRLLTRIAFGRQPSQRPRGSCLRRVIVLVVLIVLIAEVVNLILRATMLGGPTTVTVNTHPLLILDSQSNNDDTFTHDTSLIRIHAGSAKNSLVFRTDNPFNFAISYDEASDNSTVIVNLDSINGGNIDITVPATTDLKLNTNSVNVSVTGVDGQMVIQSNSGNITVTNSTLEGASLLDNNSGANTITQDTLKGPVTLNDTSGKTTFDSAIEPTGLYQFISNSGSLDVTLPGSALFHVDATATNGTVTSDFPGLTVQNNEIHNNIGKSPQAVVLVQNNSGSIAIHQKAGA